MAAPYDQEDELSPEMIAWGESVAAEVEAEERTARNLALVEEILDVTETILGRRA